MLLKSSTGTRPFQLDRLQEARQVGDAKDLLGLVPAHVGEDLAVLRTQQLQRPAPKGPVSFSKRDQALGPRVHRVRVTLLGFHVDCFVVVLGIGDDRQVEPLAVGPREARVAVGAPLHRRADTVAVAQEDVVAHADLVAVIQDGCAGQGEEQAVHELDAAPVVAQQRRQPAPDAEVQARQAVLSVGAIHVVALLVGNHLERELVMVAKEQRPLRCVGDARRLGQDVDDREPILHPDRHEQARHQREVERHVALVALAEVRSSVFGPLVRFREQHPVAVAAVDVTSQLA